MCPSANTLAAKRNLLHVSESMSTAGLSLGVCGSSSLSQLWVCGVGQAGRLIAIKRCGWHNSDVKFLSSHPLRSKNEPFDLCTSVHDDERHWLVAANAQSLAQLSSEGIKDELMVNGCLSEIALALLLVLYTKINQRISLYKYRVTFCQCHAGSCRHRTTPPDGISGAK